MQTCAHEGWGKYPEERGAVPKPALMEGPCEHNQRCPVCKTGFHIWPCGHEFNSAPLVYRTAVNSPTEVR